MRYQVTLVRLTIVKRQKTSEDEDVEEKKPCALLAGMEIGSATMEISMKVPQKFKNNTAL